MKPSAIFAGEKASAEGDLLEALRAHVETFWVQFFVAHAQNINLLENDSLTSSRLESCNHCNWGSRAQRLGLYGSRVNPDIEPEPQPRRR